MTNSAPHQIKIALAQLNPIVGDVSGNLERARAAHKDATRLGADLLVFSELFISGYPPEDLVLKPAFVAACERAVRALAETVTPDTPAILIGSPWLRDNQIMNAAALLDDGQVQSLTFKVRLPNYGVFDEVRTFLPGPYPGPLNVRGVKIGVPICEDIWFDDVVECLEETGAELLISPNGSPYDSVKYDVRIQVAVQRVVESSLPLIYVHQVGGQDELVFDGGSFALNSDRSLVVQLPQFAEVLALTTWERGDEGWTCVDGPLETLTDRDEADWQACVLGLRDYVQKNGFSDVILGLSGGIDSAVVAAMAVDALGSDKVRALMLPYRYTSQESRTDAAQCAKALGLTYDVVEIAAGVEGVMASLADLFAGRDADITEENMQSRLRGVTLMAMSNKFGSLLLTTGNKSEMAVGYATLYGDMNGAFNPIKDLYKTRVYDLAAWRNAHKPAGALGPDHSVIPSRILTKAPSAELRENQTDQDSLPPYDELDSILYALVEHERTLDDIVHDGHDLETVQKIERLLYISEYKRYQAAPGPKISTKAFGRDRRYPLTNRFRDRP